MKLDKNPILKAFIECEKKMKNEKETDKKMADLSIYKIIE